MTRLLGQYTIDTRHDAQATLQRSSENCDDCQLSQTTVNCINTVNFKEKGKARDAQPARAQIK